MPAPAMDAPAATATATAKRKRAAAAAAPAPAPARAPAVDAVDDVSDAEVEQFYAILRRMRDASRRLVRSEAGDAAARPPQRAPAWRPSFSWEDFAPAAPSPAPRQRSPDERVAENATPPRPPAPAGLDLNAEPEPDAPPTPRTAAA